MISISFIRTLERLAYKKLGAPSFLERKIFLPLFLFHAQKLSRSFLVMASCDLLNGVKIKYTITKIISNHRFSYAVIYIKLGIEILVTIHNKYKQLCRNKIRRKDCCITITNQKIERNNSYVQSNNRILLLYM